jgi:hypothetical protein
MPFFFGLTLAAIEKRLKGGPIVRVVVGALAGTISSVVALELVRLAVIGLDRYLHSWKVLGWYSVVANIGIDSLILGGWLCGGMASLGWYVQSSRAGRVSSRG